MNNKHERISIGVFGMASTFLDEKCHDDRTEGQQSFLKIAKSAVEVRLAWHGVYVGSKTGGQVQAVVY
jgi:hypothetical protein